MSTARNRTSVPTSFDVAKRVGVSQSTVSLVLAGKAAGRVSPATQEAVLRAAYELGYRPHTAARTLRSGRANVIALIVPDISKPFFAAVLKGVEEAARLKGYAVILICAGDDQDWQQIVVDTLATRAVDGFVFCAVNPPVISDVHTLKQQAVIIDGTTDQLPALHVDVDGGIHEALQHLLNLGHHNIAYLAANTDLAIFKAHQQLYERILQNASIPIIPAYTQCIEISVEAGQVAAEELFCMDTPPSALFCDDDLLAVGVYKAAQKQGVPIPDELSVISFDRNHIAYVLEPELTTVSIPAVMLGRRAIEVLSCYLEKVASPAVPEIIPTSLLIRKSTARCRKEK